MSENYRIETTESSGTVSPEAEEACHRLLKMWYDDARRYPMHSALGTAQSLFLSLAVNSNMSGDDFDELLEGLSRNHRKAVHRMKELRGQKD